MPDENSTPIWTNQILTNQSWDDNDFVLDFWEGEDMKEINDSEKKTDMNFDINTNDEENKNSGDSNFNTDDLFGEISEDKNAEDTDLWNTFVDTQKNDANNNEDNNDFFADMSLDNWDNADKDTDNLDESEENNELFSESESNIPDKNVEDLNLGNGTEIENNQDELFWETEKENNKSELEQIEELPLESQENKVDEDPDFTMEEIWNMTTNLEENENTLVSENDHLLDNAESGNDIDDKIRENSDMASENEKGNSWDDLFWEILDQNTTDEEQIDINQESDNVQWDVDDKIDFSFDSNDSNGLAQESITDEKDEVIDSNNSESIFLESWNNEINTVNNEAEKFENTDDVNFDFSVGQDNSDNDEIQNNEDLTMSSSDTNMDNTHESENNDLFWNDLISQDENKESITNVDSNNMENFIQDEKNLENDEENVLDKQNISQDSINEWNNQENWEFLLDNANDETWDDNIKDVSEMEQNQETMKSTDSANTLNQEVTQPDMMNLLWWQSVDFSYEENAASIDQSENNLGSYQNESSANLQNNSGRYTSDNENNIVNDSEVQGKDNLNIINSGENAEIITPLQSTNTWNLEQNTENQVNYINTNAAEIQSQTILKTPEENTTNETLQINENNQNQTEVWSIKSTLSLDEILDSELQSNPQFADNSKSIPKNTQNKSTFLGRKKMTIFAWVWVFLLFCIVIALAFPSISSERKIGDVVNTWTVVEEPGEPENPIEEVTNPTEYTGTDKDSQTSDQWNKTEEEEIVKKNHWSWPTTELIEDEPTEDIKPYIFEGPEEEPGIPTEEERPKKISIEDVQSKISSFKSQGEWYKKVGENESNEKVTKYAAYVVRLCDDYQSQINNWEWIDEETFSSFETKVLWFITKIEKNLNWWDEVSTIYTKVDFDENEDKKELRAYLEENR